MSDEGQARYGIVLSVALNEQDRAQIATLYKIILQRDDTIERMQGFAALDASLIAALLFEKKQLAAEADRLRRLIAEVNDSGWLLLEMLAQEIDRLRAENLRLQTGI